MQDLDKNQFSYFHDATLESITHEVNQDGLRSVCLRVTTDDDTGLEELNSLRLSISFSDVLLFEARMLGYTANPEEIDAWDSSVPRSVRAELKKLTNAGISSPEHISSIGFHSGSSLVIACQTIKMTEVV